jgi:hypothetical protein
MLRICDSSKISYDPNGVVQALGDMHNALLCNDVVANIAASRTHAPHRPTLLTPVCKTAATGLR